MPQPYSRIRGTGSYVPPRVVPNSELEGQLQTTDKWVRDKIGIEERRYVDDGVGSTDLAYHAATAALNKAKLSSGDIEAIVFATETPDHHAPGGGTMLQQRLGCKAIPAFDIRNTSPGFLFALELADQMIRAGKYQRILVVASEVHSTGLDFSPRGRLMSVIFGDGAGAMVLEADDGGSGILATKLYSDGTHYDKLWCEAPSSKHNPRITQQMIDEGQIYPTMDGRLVFANAVKLMSEATQAVLADQNLTIADVDHVIPHQANLRIIETIGEKLNLPISKVHLTIQKYGNTSAASIPLTLDEANQAGHFKPGQLLLVMSFGSGFSWGAGLIRW